MLCKITLLLFNVTYLYYLLLLYYKAIFICTCVSCKLFVRLQKHSFTLQMVYHYYTLKSLYESLITSPKITAPPMVNLRSRHCTNPTYATQLSWLYINKEQATNDRQFFCFYVVLNEEKYEICIKRKLNRSENTCYKEIFF